MKKINLILTALFLVFFVAQTNLPAQSSRPTVAVKPEPGAAPASIFVDGLSVLSNSSQSTEIGFVRDDHYDIEIQIFKQTGCGEVPLKRKLIAGEKLKIEIYETGIPSPFPSNVFFQPAEPNAEDFRLMPDMCSTKWFQSTNSLPFQPDNMIRDHLSGKLILNGAVHYTESVSFNRVIRTDSSSTAFKAPREKFGKILGADIICRTENCGVTIRISGDKQRIPVEQPLNPAEGPYFILVRTRAMSNADHLHHIYDKILNLPGTYPKFSFKYEKRNSQEDEWEPPCAKRKTRRIKNGKSYSTYYEETKATDYACQTFGVCGGTLPELW